MSSDDLGDTPVPGGQDRNMTAPSSSAGPKSPDLSTGNLVDNVENPPDDGGNRQQNVRNDVLSSGFSPENEALSTRNSGQPDDYDPGHVDEENDETESDLGTSALAAARAIASGKARTSMRRRRRRASDEATYSSARADGRDPAAIGAIFRKAIPELGWATPLAEARLLGQWEAIVGREVAAHCHPVSLTDGDLKITAESTAWATQLRLLAPRLLAKICEQVPPGMVKRLVISGPSGPSWKKGPWSMPGGRGPRDTYG